jgi:uncharacterized protein YdeI (YjbR/CyaY-like superfamily)
MATKQISAGVVHDVPGDLAQALTSAPAALAAWESLTPLARNEWICWNITVKQESTRKHHIQRTVAELQEGKRRPCCWVGCMHRTDKPLSPTMRWMLAKQSK